MINKYETDMYNNYAETYNKITNILKNRDRRTDNATISDIERVVSNLQAVQERLAESVSDSEKRIEDYFWQNNIEVYTRKDNGTIIYYKTSDGKFVETFNGELFKEGNNGHAEKVL